MTEGTPVEAHAALGRLVADGIDEIIRAEEGWADIVEEAAYSVDVETRDRGTWTISVARKADAGSTTREGGEEVRFYKLPFTLHEPKDDGAAYIRDANGGAVAMLMWPGHSLEDTDAATEETYRIGRAMAAAITTSSPDASPDSGDVQERAAKLAEGARELAVSLGYVKPRGIAADRIGAVGMRLAADIRALAASPASLSGGAGEAPLAMILDAHLPSMTGRFRLPPGLALASGVFALTRLRSPTDADQALWSHLPEPPHDAFEVAERAAELVREHAARLGMDSMAADVLARAVMDLGKDPE